MNLQQTILRDADRCVLCGMCLPHCPTYVLTGNEAESPRGRISLMLALARGQLEASDALVRHIDSCLACRACETKCPSEVRYGQLIGNARRLIAERRQPSLRARALAALTSRAGLLRRAVALARTRGGKRALHMTGLRKVEMLLAPSVAASTFTTAAPATPRGRVALFTGCTAQAFDAETVSAAHALLCAAGFQVEIPEQQVCCGAIHHSLGDRAGFEQRARANLAAFDPAHFDAIVFVASGCGAMLTEYGEWLGDEARAFTARCVEVTDFLARQGFPAGTRFRPLADVVAIHVPCSQSNVLKAGSAAERLLMHLPQIQMHALPGNNVCCGAAGSHMLLHAESAAALREPKLQALARSGARYVVTTNVGCALHLAAGARERGQPLEVLHPVALLARQMIAEAPLAVAAVSP